MYALIINKIPEKLTTEIQGGHFSIINSFYGKIGIHLNFLTH